jgi:hypothetical protein
MICVHDENVTLFKTDEGVFREGWGESVDIFCHSHILEIDYFWGLSMTEFIIHIILKLWKLQFLYKWKNKLSLLCRFNIQPRGVAFQAVNSVCYNNPTPWR